MPRVATLAPQIREGAIKSAVYQPDKRQLSATIRWSLESSDARDELRSTLDRSNYVNPIAKRRELVTTMRWSLESSDARQEVRELFKSKRRKPFAARLHQNVHELPVPEFSFDWGYGTLSLESLRLHLPSTKAKEPAVPVIEDVPEREYRPKAKIKSDSILESPYTLPPPPYDTTEPSVPLQALIGEAILASKDGGLTLRQITDYIRTVYPFYASHSSNLTKRLWGKLKSSYFVVAQEKSKDGVRNLNLYSIADADLACFPDGRFQPRKVESKKGKRKQRDSEMDVEVDGDQRKRLRTSITNSSPEYDAMPLPPVAFSPDDKYDEMPFPSASAFPDGRVLNFTPLPRSRTQSASPPTHRSFHLSAHQPLQPSSSMPSMPFHSPKKLVPVRSWAQPSAYRGS